MGEQLAGTPSTVALPSTPSTVFARAANRLGITQVVDLIEGVHARFRVGDPAAATDGKEVA